VGYGLRPMDSPWFSLHKPAIYRAPDGGDVTFLLADNGVAVGWMLVAVGGGDIADSMVGQTVSAPGRFMVSLSSRSLAGMRGDRCSAISVVRFTYHMDRTLRYNDETKGVLRIFLEPSPW
jgi:hypothetical protein